MVLCFHSFGIGWENGNTCHEVMRESFEDFVERFLEHVSNVIPMKIVASCAYDMAFLKGESYFVYHGY